MKNLYLILLTFFTFSTMSAQSLVGIWETGEDNTIIEITEENNVVSGKIFSSENSEVKIGKQILKDVKFNEGEYKGKMYAAKKEKWYDAVLKTKGDELEIKIKVGFMSKTLKWNRSK